jgi:ATP-dependent RNA helicase RhlE
LKFIELNFDARLQEGIEASNYETATPVQELVIPEILQGNDIIASAQTGTGKTAAFLLPLMHKILTQKQAVKGITTLIIVPTRELAIQIAQHLDGLSYFTNLSSIAVYGGGDGNNFVQEKIALTNDVDFVVCTPGKMMGHIKMGYVKLQQLQYLVLDEADRMLDMGFYDDINYIIQQLPVNRQTLLFSATMPPKIRSLAQKLLKNPKEVTISISKPPEKIKQYAYIVYDNQKIPLILDLLQQTDFKKIVVFCSSKLSVKQLTKDLQRKKLNAAEIHSDLNQEEREQVLMQFKSDRLRIIVATDLLSRGIDIDNIDLVINYDVPRDGEDYVHRIGRTARADTNGTAYTLVNEKEQRKFFEIEKLIEKEVEKCTVPEALGQQPQYNATVFAQPRKKWKSNYKKR